MANEPDPNCPECHGEGRIQEGTCHGNSDGGEDWREIDCPACIEISGPLTPEQIIQARDTKIAMLQGVIRAMTETAIETDRIKVEDHATIRRLRSALTDIIANEDAYNRGDALSAYIAKSALNP